MCAPTVSSTTSDARYLAAFSVAEASPVRNAFRYASTARTRVFIITTGSRQPDVPVIRRRRQEVLQIHDVGLLCDDVGVWRQRHDKRLVEQIIVDLAIHLLAFGGIGLGCDTGGELCPRFVVEPRRIVGISKRPTQGELRASLSKLRKRTRAEAHTVERRIQSLALLGKLRRISRFEVGLDA